MLGKGTKSKSNEENSHVDAEPTTNSLYPSLSEKQSSNLKLDPDVDSLPPPYAPVAAEPAPAAPVDTAPAAP